MARMLPGIHTIEQHQQRLEDDPDAYRPERCPHCGKAGLHHHGCYERNAPRGEGLAFSLKPLFIPRFVCPQCRCTCSRLPACLAPLRQYWWEAQAAVFRRMLGGASLRAVARACSPSRRTVGRWWHWLKDHFVEHRFHLCSRFADLGRAVNFCQFWRTCLEHMSFEQAMGWLEHEGVAVP